MAADGGGAGDGAGGSGDLPGAGQRVRSHSRSVGLRVGRARRDEFVAADQEGGQIQLLRGPGFPAVPTALAQGGLAPAALRRAASAWGRQLLAAGVTMNLAPVLGTVPPDLGRGNVPLGYHDREYGHTPDTVSAHGTAFLQGMADARMPATAKHFPGLGRVRGNTDTTSGVTDDTTTRNGPYLQPFAAAVGAGVPVVMVSLARYTRIDPAHRAVFSPTVLQGMLRGDLGFTGVIVSDSMAATAVGDLAPADRALRFLQAGGTVVLDTDSTEIPAMVDAVTARATRDAAFRSLVRDDARTVLLAKYGEGLVACPAPDDPIARHATDVAGVVGPPTGPEHPVAGGRVRAYRGGTVAWSARTGAHAVNGAIAAHVRALGGAAGLLGFPTTDERAAPDGVGRYNHFSGTASGSSIYWTPATGAHEVLGAIRARWASLGWERSSLGYPVSGEYTVAGGRRSDFQHGSITWNRATGRTTVVGR